jgi:hypothetical protein
MKKMRPTNLYGTRIPRTDCAPELQMQILFAEHTQKGYIRAEQFLRVVEDLMNYTYRIMIVNVYTKTVAALVNFFGRL